MTGRAVALVALLLLAGWSSCESEDERNARRIRYAILGALTYQGYPLPLEAAGDE